MRKYSVVFFFKAFVQKKKKLFGEVFICIWCWDDGCRIFHLLGE